MRGRPVSCGAMSLTTARGSGRRRCQGKDHKEPVPNREVIFAAHISTTGTDVIEERGIAKGLAAGVHTLHQSRAGAIQAQLAPVSDRRALGAAPVSGKAR